MNQSLLQSKFYRPAQQSGILMRQRLFDQMDQALSAHQRLILVCAPAGSGKTTLVSDWTTRSKQECAWLALDNDDNAPERFMQYFLFSIRQAAENSGAADSFENLVPDPDTFWHELIHAFEQMEKTMLIVLDDYHLIKTEAIHQGIASLLDYLPPQISLIITTRSDPPLPVARLRTRQQLTEIRDYELRFTALETHDFLNITSELKIDDNDIEVLYKRTEGWVAGLRLAVLSLKHHDNPAAFIEHFAGSNRFILDYLTEEVLLQQPAEIQTFLLKTSILTRFDAGICREVTGLVNSVDILEILFRDNLFLIPLDTGGQTYRYHHLFGDLLQMRLQQKMPDRLPGLHLCAAQWYESHQNVHLALHHYLQGQHHGQAADLVEREAFTLYNRGNLPALVNLIQQLPPQLALQRPWLNAYTGFFLTLSGQVIQGEQALNRASQSADDRPLQGFIAATRVHVFCARLQFQLAREQAQIALDNVPLDMPYINSFSLYGMGKVLMSLGKLAEARQILLQALELGEMHGHLINIIPLLAYLAQIALLEHDLSAADACLRKAEHYTAQDRVRTSRLAAFWQIPRAELYLEKQQFEEALSMVNIAIENSLKHHNVFSGVQAYLLRARIQDAMALPDEAAATLHEAQATMQPYPVFLDLLAMFHLQKAQHAQQMGNLDEAEAHLRNCDPGESVLLANQKQALLSELASSRQPSKNSRLHHPNLVEQLSAREHDVLQCIGNGMTNQDIADKLFISLSTVKKHSSSIYGKLGVRTRTQAINRARQLGLLA